MTDHHFVRTDLHKLDLSILESCYEGLPKFMLRQALSSYLTEVQEYVASIKAAPQPDSPQVILCFHNMKTMSGMIGAVDMVTLCKNFENSTTVQERAEFVRQLEPEWASLQTELHLLLQDENFNQAN